MTPVTKLIVIAGPLLWLALTVLAGYAYSQILFLSLPIPKALGLFTVALPLITAVSRHGTSVLIKRSSGNEQAQLVSPLLAIIGFQLFYETIVATLAIIHIIPPSALRCGLNDKWQRLFVDKNGGAVRAIQDSFNCCGFYTLKDRAWPFNVNEGHNGPSHCADYTHRTSSCFGAWRQSEQVNAGLLLLVAVIVLIAKIFSVISLLTNRWNRPRWIGAAGQLTNGSLEDAEGEYSRAPRSRLLGEHDPVGEYSDEPQERSSQTEEAPSSDRGRHPRIEPSPLTEHGDAWRI